MMMNEIEREINPLVVTVDQTRDVHTLTSLFTAVATVFGKRTADTSFVAHMTLDDREKAWSDAPKVAMYREMRQALAMHLDRELTKARKYDKLMADNLWVRVWRAIWR